MDKTQNPILDYILLDKEIRYLLSKLDGGFSYHRQAIQDYHNEIVRHISEIDDLKQIVDTKIFAIELMEYTLLKKQKKKIYSVYMLFNLDKGEVLEFVFKKKNEDIKNIVDNIKMIIEKENFCDGLTKLHIKSNLYKIKEQFSSIKYVAPLYTDMDEKLQILFNMTDSKIMLTLFGHLLAECCYGKYTELPRMDFNFYSKNTELFKSLYETMNLIFNNNDNIIYAENILNDSNETGNNIVKIIKNNDYIIIDSLSTKKANSAIKDQIFKSFYKKNELPKYKKSLYDYQPGVIIFSNTPFEYTNVRDIKVDSCNTDKFIEIKKYIADIAESVDWFKSYLDKIYAPNSAKSIFGTLTLEEDKIIKKAEKKVYKEININSPLIGDSNIKPLVHIVLALSDYFNFLKACHYITEEQYSMLNNLRISLYNGKLDNSPQTVANNTAAKHKEDFEVCTIVKIIKYMYDNKIALTEDRTNPPFIFVGSKKTGHLVCFSELEDVLPLIEENIPLPDESLSSDAKILLSNKDIDYEKLLSNLFEKQLISVDKNRKKYSIKVDGFKKQFIAFNVNMMDEFLTGSENP